MKKGEKVLVGGALGLMVGGPVGALVGAFIGDVIKPAKPKPLKKPDGISTLKWLNGGNDCG